ncbi:MAG: PDZ domain-containing protein [Anaerolineae bacterium]|nr:PDZ domain-containing protein [Anaerolineae bacterium]
MNRSISTGKNALVMGVAIIAASLMLASSLSGSTMVSLALQNTETPTDMVEVTATVEMSATPASDGGATASPASSSGMTLPPCLDVAAPSSTDTTGAGATATDDMSVPASDMTAIPDTGSKVTATSGPTSYLGVVVTAVGDCGVRVLEVFADSPAFQGQLAVGDVIVAVNGIPVTDLTSMQNTRPEGTMSYASLTTAGFFTAIHALPPTTQVTLTVQRGDQTVDVMVTLGDLTVSSPSIDIEGTFQPLASSTPGSDTGSTPEASSTPELSGTPETAMTPEASTTP